MQIANVVIPAYNEADIILTTLSKFEEFNNQLSEKSLIRFKKIVVVHNGTTDSSPEAIAKLTPQLHTLDIHQLFLDKPNKGAAQVLGANYLLDTHHSNQAHWVYFCDADFPFGFSEFEFLSKHQNILTHADLIIGSKAHSESTHYEHPFFRLVYRLLLRSFRYLFLRLKVKDTQGSLLVKPDLLIKILPSIWTSEFHFPIEFIWRAQQESARIIEVPVRFFPITLRPSKVRPIGDGLRLLGQILYFSLNKTRQKTTNRRPNTYSD